MELSYKYKTISVKHLKEVHDDMNELYRQGKLHDNERYKRYLSPERFTPPDDFLNAKFIIIIARFSPLMQVNFVLNGRKYDVMLPPECYHSGMTDDAWTNLIEKEIIKQPGYRIRQVERIPLKLLAVRSGLGKYGRNNICYVDEMGSFITLHGFFTDFEFPQDSWQEMKMMDKCESCRLCMHLCPCGCIREDNFVIDTPRCVTWYNEHKGEFPGWMAPDIHNALIGCMQCQLLCPANAGAREFTGRFEDVPQEDTTSILNGDTGDRALESICRIFGPFTKAEWEDSMPILQRNLNVLIKPSCHSTCGESF